MMTTLNLLKKQVKKKNHFKEVHDDDEDTARIGRSGDPLKAKKI